MARVSACLSYPGTPERASGFCRAVFGDDFHKPCHRIGEVPSAPGRPPLSEADQHLVMHVDMTIRGGHVLMGTDTPESMGFTVVHGNGVHIDLEPDTRAETDRLVAALSSGAKVEMPLPDMFRRACFGSLTDPFGIRRMFNGSSLP